MDDGGGERERTDCSKPYRVRGRPVNLLHFVYSIKVAAGDIATCQISLRYSMCLCIGATPAQPVELSQGSDMFNF